MPGTWNWRLAARCRTSDAEKLFVRGARQREARLFCRPCPVRTECLAHALDHRVEWGVWGGMTERERRAILRRRPGVKSWAELLGRAQREYYASLNNQSSLAGDVPARAGDRRTEQLATAAPTAARR